MFEGLSVAMVTPFRQGEVDYPALDRLLDHLLEGGVDGIIPLGTTGEGPTVSLEERSEIVKRSVQRARSASSWHIWRTSRSRCTRRSRAFMTPRAA